MTECHSCRKWSESPCKPFYYPGELVFCRWQVLWLLCHLEAMGRGDYPHIGSDITFGMVKGYRQGAYFETPAGIAGELRYRLERTGKDGEILLAYLEDYESRDSEDEIYNRWETLSGAAKSALNYVSGKWRRRESYRQWKNRQNVGLGMVS